MLWEHRWAYILGCEILPFSRDSDIKDATKVKVLGGLMGGEPSVGYGQRAPSRRDQPRKTG